MQRVHYLYKAVAVGFVDHVRFYARSGKGGAGSSHFRRVKYIPRGGPDGGDGGKGGSIWIEVDPQLSTLLHLRYTKQVIASSGQPGGAQQMKGADGADVVLRVPPGTVVRDASDQFLFELLEPDGKKLLLPGGKGGKGNTYFKSPVRQAPRYAQPGEPCQEALFSLELKVLADIGLIGAPNAGKSTLLSRVSAAKPVIAAYPFTTLQPQLGVVSLFGETEVVMAEIPGLIEGAADGRGIGHRFLRHAERTRLLVFLISLEEADPVAAYEMLASELVQHSPAFAEKQRLICLTKLDMAEELAEVAAKKSLLTQYGPCIALSALGGEGLDELKQQLWAMVRKPAVAEPDEAG